ncbi:MAG: hypothetical protein JSW71_03905 [Gemmatimonadota bacterium]|nr:MAG: hypothetical protein JSW71_03905 [Gemmatimonadota bacterium]
MKVRMTAEMLTGLKQMPELPADLVTAVNESRPLGDFFLVQLSDDEAIELTEMCQWYIKSDPVTGQLTEKAEVFDSIVAAIDEAQFD